MKLVLTNDDGIDAPGMLALRELCAPFGDLMVVAPDSPQSGVGHAVNTDEPISFDARSSQEIAVAGTPADCARVALSTFAPEATWLIAGINHGANLGVDAYVSGTVAAAREAAILGVPAIALSQYVGRHRQPDWASTVRRAQRVIRALLDEGARPGRFWNVNLPHPVDESDTCEVVRCRQDPSPHAVRFERRAGTLEWMADYHARPRRSDHDVDVCFGGRIAVSELSISDA